MLKVRNQSEPLSNEVRHLACVRSRILLTYLRDYPVEKTQHINAVTISIGIRFGWIDNQRSQDATHG
jgi:hypothetical protein